MTPYLAKIGIPTPKNPLLVYMRSMLLRILRIDIFIELILGIVILFLLFSDIVFSLLVVVGA